VHADAVEEITPVELGRPFERRMRAVLDQSLKLGHVYVDSIGIERDGIPPGDQR
jgi:hypothetical protein